MKFLLFLVILLESQRCLSLEIDLGTAPSVGCSKLQFENGDQDTIPMRSWGSSPTSLKLLVESNLDNTQPDLLRFCAESTRDEIGPLIIAEDPVSATPVFQEKFQRCVLAQRPRISIELYGLVLRTSGPCGQGSKGQKYLK
ncbi:hypothetical protein [Paraburkholderia strydomiana]|uniref:hypothetical protein n=1 Tax=Paraburkholderia strydomiana TaxID=1245417 RepID=UPI00285F05E0|nr:hypothetical protein [Paraburkholderia strydomiana]MDR7009956.1 hypothetical protein [Paraburkholderia strydomiana]